MYEGLTIVDFNVPAKCNGSNSQFMAHVQGVRQSFEQILMLDFVVALYVQLTTHTVPQQSCMSTQTCLVSRTELMFVPFRRLFLLIFHPSFFSFFFLVSWLPLSHPPCWMAGR